MLRPVRSQLLARLEQISSMKLLARATVVQPLWGVGAGLPGPVEFSMGRPIAPPIMPGWDGYPVRDRLATRYQVPAWVDNDVNVMALGELRAGIAHGEQDLIYVKVGTGIGAGLISAGSLHRVPKAWPVTSVTSRSSTTTASSAAVGTRAASKRWPAATPAGTDWRPPAPDAAWHSPTCWRRPARITARDVTAAAHALGRPRQPRPPDSLGWLVGRVLATLVNFYNPSLIVMGGQVSSGEGVFLGDAMVDGLQPLPGAGFAICGSGPRPLATALGCWRGLPVAHQLFSRNCLAQWIHDGSPVGRPEVSSGFRSAQHGHRQHAVPFHS